MRPSAFERGGELAEQQQRRDAVLVAHVLGGDAVAERLLVAEGQALDPADPLEAGERLGVAAARPPRRSAEQRARRRSRWRRCRCLPWRAGGAASSAPTSSPRSIRQPCASGDGGGAPVGVGVVGDDQVGVAARAASAIARSIAPGSSGLGKATVGKSGSGSACCGHDVRRGEAGGSSTWTHGRAADAVQRRVDEVEVARAVVGEPGDRVEVAVDDLLAEDLVRPRPRGTSASGADRGDPGRDLGVGRRHDLAAVAEVDLVAVVLGRVVAGGDHHAGDAAELADRVGQHRGGQRPGQQSAFRPAPVITSAVSWANTSELCRASYPITTAAVAGGALVHAGTPRGRRPRGARPPGSSGWGRPERPAQPGGAELEGAGEPVGQVRGVAAGRHRVDDPLQLGRVCGSGSSAAQSPGAVEQVGGVHGGHAPTVALRGCGVSPWPP